MFLMFPDKNIFPDHPYILGQEVQLARLMALACLVMTPYLARTEDHMPSRVKGFFLEDG